MRLTRAAGFLLFGLALWAPARGHIRKTSPNGIIVSVAGNRNHCIESIDRIPATSARLNSPAEVAVDGAGTVFIKEVTGIRKFSTSGIITTVVSAVPCDSSWSAITTGGDPMPCIGVGGSGTGSFARSGLFMAGMGNIRKVSPKGVITTITGDGGLFAGYSGDGGPASSATGVWGPLTVGGAGNLSIASGGHIRKISSPRVVEA